MAQGAAHKPGAKQNGVSVDRWIQNRRTHFFREFSRQYFVGIEQQNPVVSQRQGIRLPIDAFSAIHRDNEIGRRVLRTFLQSRRYRRCSESR